MNENDYYAILKVPFSSSIDEINRAYRKLALKYHPDRNKDKDSEAIFLKIKKAHEVLTNEQSRREYDAKIQAEILRKKRNHALKDDLLERERQYELKKKKEEEAKRKYNEQRRKEREEVLRMMEEEQQRLKKMKEEMMEEEKKKKKAPPHSNFKFIFDEDEEEMDDDLFEQMVLEKMRLHSRRKQAEAKT